MIPNGYILLAKKTLKSEIYRMAPFYREIWIHLLMSVRFNDQTENKNKNYESIKAGQIYTTYDKISEGLHWYENKKKCQYTRRQVEKALSYFRKQNMVKTKKYPRGVVITICNYKEYQASINYKNNNVGHQNIEKNTIKTDSYDYKKSNLGHQTLNLGHQMQHETN